MTHPVRLAAMFCAATLTASATPALADPRDDRIKALEQKLDALAEEIKALRGEQAAEKAAQGIPLAPAKPA